MSAARFSSPGAGLRADLRRGIAVASGAMAAAALIELIVTLIAYSGPLHVFSVLRLAALDATLAALAWLPITAVAAGASLLPRLYLRAVRGRDAARGYLGPFARRLDGVWVSRGLAALAVGALYLVWSSQATATAFANHKDDKLIGLVLGAEQLVVIAVLGAVALGLAALFDLARRQIDRVPVLRRFNPLGRTEPALIVVGGAGLAWLLLYLYKDPKHAYMRPIVPWRWMFDAAAMLVGAMATVAVLRVRPLLPRDRKKRKRVALGIAAAALVIMPLTLVRWGGEPDTKGIAISASPAMDKMIAEVRWANDFDGDGFGSLLGENDCGPFDPAIHPGARDIPDDGIDQNCDGADATMRDLIAPAGEKMAIPDRFKKPWNVLLITIDATRYDHTTFGGYKDESGRDTTPNLEALAERSVSFTFANAPSAGTMASMPAIMTSKFFHDGIALDENRKPGMPPKVKPENVLIGEVMKRGHYVTGAITSHQYFDEDWGLNQGIDEYDNTIGKTATADSVSSDQSTNRALAWIARHADQKWFLWVHYFDPHGHYVAHPDGPQYSGSDSEMDLYDGEIHYTDEWLGKLFDEMQRLPGADHTIIIITADHGDAFMEHGTRNHGDTLYHELLRVPLIFAIPDLPPRKIGGAVSNLDILPTVADLCGIDVSDLTFEGRSLVPQLFYGKEDDNRVVFAETNYQNVLRAAVSAHYKLIYDLKNNHYRLYNLQTDPGEKNDVAQKDTAGMGTMKAALDAWLERVMFSRDVDQNQVMTKVQGILLESAPTPANLVAGTSVDDGRIEVLGWSPDPSSPPIKAGNKIKVAVYFAVHDVPKAPYKLQLTAWLTIKASFDPKGPIGPKVARSALRTTADGFLPTDQWRKGDYIRDVFELTLPADWNTGDSVGFGVTFQGDAGKVPATGQVATADPTLAILGIAPLDGVPPMAPAPAGPVPPTPVPPTPMAPPPAGKPSHDAGVAAPRPIAPSPVRKLAGGSAPVSP